MDSIQLKQTPEEFCVVENLTMPYTIDTNNQYYYFELFKIGFSTFDAISLISKHFLLDTFDISYAGLKDEDAVTKQLIAINKPLEADKVDIFNAKFNEPLNCISLTLTGAGKFPLRIGKLNGNGFYLTVRNLSQEIKDRLKIGNQMVYFINYYDTQRFGVPNAPKITHHIGKALIDDDYERAFELIKKNRTTESELALSFNGSAKEFFDTIDKRKLSFFMCSYSSFIWNQDVIEQLKKVSGVENLITKDHEGIAYTYTSDSNAILSLLKSDSSITYQKYILNEERNIVLSFSTRPTVIQSSVCIDSIEEDELNSGKCKIQMSFFLPKGCYATNMVKQFVFQNTNQKVTVSGVK